MSPKELKQLTAKWYGKLKKTGFQDIESPNDPEVLSRWAYDLSRERTVNRFESTQEYYRLAGHFLYDYKFESKRDQLFWKLHSEGKTCKQISDSLPMNRIKKVTLDTVNKAILRLTKIMKAMYGTERTSTN